ncbi:MAG: pectin esterase [Pedobacter sp.]|nr:MAG: pectin esterase [Pedobacter sp.]
MMKHPKLPIIILALIGFLLFSAMRMQPKRKQLFLIGDSTLTDYSLEVDYATKRFPMVGWGQVIQAFFQPDSIALLPNFLRADEIQIVNKAKGGRSTRTFFEEGRWLEVYNQLQEGDVVLIQFGHNDAAIDKPDRYVDLAGYASFLKRYVLESRRKGATPILITPVARNYPWKDSQLENVHGDYPAQMMTVAKELQVDLIDLNTISCKAFSKLGQAYVSKNFFMNLEPGKYKAYPEGLKDNTHFQEAGAKYVAGLVFNSLKQLKAYDFVVAQDGSGDFKTITEAFAAVPDFRKVETRILIKPGVYKEKLNLSASKNKVTLIGEDARTCILSFDDFAQKKNRFGEEMGTSGSASFYVYGNEFTAENLTFQNTSGPVGQAVALLVAGDKAKFINCRMLGFQDTLYTYGYGSRQYYYNCYIEGTVDFIFGSATAYFEACEIYGKKAGYLTASSAPDSVSYGYVFKDCKIRGDAPTHSFYLGRPWRPYAKTVFLNCDMGDLIKPEGWHNWGKESNEKTAFYAEFESTGKGGNPSRRVSWAKQLSPAQAAQYSIEKVFRDWNPKSPFHE